MKIDLKNLENIKFFLKSKKCLNDAERQDQGGRGGGGAPADGGDAAVHQQGQAERAPRLPARPHRVLHGVQAGDSGGRGDQQGVLHK